MEAIRCNFFNGADPAERKITWVSWDKVLASKKNGGLGVSSFHALNRALLLKWVWCFILKMGLFGFDFVSHCKKCVEDGHNTRFWYDSWVFDQPLRVRFPRLFALETDKKSTDDLNSVSGSVTLSASKDRWICDLNGDGVFRVKEVRTILDDIFLPSAADTTRWVKYIPIKINVFAWGARLDRLPTRSNLVRRGVVLDSSLCPLCGLVHEDIHHVLFRCYTAKLVFRRICHWWDLDWHDLLSFSDWNAWFSAIRLPSRIKLILEGVFYVAWWHLWVYRNQSIFAATPPRRSVIFDDIEVGYDDDDDGVVGVAVVGGRDGGVEVRRVAVKGGSDGDGVVGGCNDVGRWVGRRLAEKLVALEILINESGCVLADKKKKWAANNLSGTKK
nr:RNA-directed DNA polymerase, eukaryota [Tanacetum cinerariifolium]